MGELSTSKYSWLGVAYTYTPPSFSKFLRRLDWQLNQGDSSCLGIRCRLKRGW